MLKKTLALVFVFALLISTSTIVFAQNSTGNLDTNLIKEIPIISGELDELDAVLAASIFLGSVGIDLDYSDIEVIPLYDLDGLISSYYVSFSSAAYAVINNNMGNPTAIEFGGGENERVREILDSSISSHIVYSNPINMWDMSDPSVDIASIMNIPSLYDIYPDLTEVNIITATLHSETRADYELMLSQMNFTMGDGDYGFIPMPTTGTITSIKTITSASSVMSWAVMSNFNHIASNHCGATAITNLALYFHQRGHTNLRITNVTQTFEAVHKIAGNGPNATIAGNAKTYFSNRGFTLNSSGANTQSTVKTALDNNRPLGTLLADGLFNWHWILSVGYLEYSSGDFYHQILTGWENRIDRYYKPGSGSVWMSSTQYWVS